MTPKSILFLLELEVVLTLQGRSIWHNLMLMCCKHQALGLSSSVPERLHLLTCSDTFLICFCSLSFPINIYSPSCFSSSEKSPFIAIIFDLAMQPKGNYFATIRKKFNCCTKNLEVPNDTLVAGVPLRAEEVAATCKSRPQPCRHLKHFLHTWWVC